MVSDWWLTCSIDFYVHIVYICKCSISDNVHISFITIANCKLFICKLLYPGVFCILNQNFNESIWMNYLKVYFWNTHASFILLFFCDFEWKLKGEYLTMKLRLRVLAIYISIHDLWVLYISTIVGCRRKCLFWLSNIEIDDSCKNITNHEKGKKTNLMFYFIPPLCLFLF